MTSILPRAGSIGSDIFDDFLLLDIKHADAADFCTKQQLQHADIDIG